MLILYDVLLDKTVYRCHTQTEAEYFIDEYIRPDDLIIK
jgi:hypothetical protein